MRAAVDGRSRIARRALLVGVLADLEAGACSVLEQGYLRRVERAHALPVAERQVRASTRGTAFRDVEYAPWARWSSSTCPDCSDCPEGQRFLAATG